jgi:hypothetical protein
MFITILAYLFDFMNIRLKFLFSFILPFCIKVEAQNNLVPDPGFEIITNCVSAYYSMICDGKAIKWKCATNGTSDLYTNSCANNNNNVVSIPSNFIGFQNPKEGINYAGIICKLYQVSNANNYREYLQTKLTFPLVQGKKYCVSFFASRANNCEYATNNLGAFFSDTAIHNTSQLVLNYTPQINYSGVLIDTVSWTRISGIIQANGGEQYITIGNFYDDANTSEIYFGTNIVQGHISYYYIDLVEVYEFETIDAGLDKEICLGDSVKIGNTNLSYASYSWHPSLGLNDSAIATPIASPTQNTMYYVTQYTNCGYSIDSILVKVFCPEKPVELFIPTLLSKQDFFQIGGLRSGANNLKIYDSLGQLVYQNEMYDNKFNAAFYKSGFYYYSLQIENQDSRKGKILIID